MNYVLIGDIHSQAAQLKDALSFVRSNLSDSRVVFLGDIFDSKCDYSDSYSVYQMIREAEKEFNAITLQSNHQDKLIRYFRGNKVELNNGLDKTVLELTKEFSKRLDLESFYSWLIRCPFGIAFKDFFGIEFRCAHAYFSPEVKVFPYKELYLVKALTMQHKHEFLYGLQDSKKRRVFWWEDDNTKQEYVRVSGHYKTVSLNLDNKSLVLDSCCGDINGSLTIFDVNSRMIHQF